MGQVIKFVPKQPFKQAPTPVCKGNDMPHSWFSDDDPLFVFSDDANFVPRLPRDRPEQRD